MEQVNENDQLLKTAVRWMLGTFAVGIVALMLVLLQTPLGTVWQRLADALLGVSSGQMTWFITRASGLVAYLLLWLSTVWGIGVSSKFFDRAVPRAFTYDAHEYISLLAIGMTAVHVVVLLWDSFAPFTVFQLVLPFISGYRPLWTGIGIISAYMTLLVTVTFYLRKWIGIQAFRAIHWFSFVAFFGVLMHGWFAGTDTTFSLTRWMYFGTAFVVVGMTALWYATKGTAPIVKEKAGVVPPPSRVFDGERRAGQATAAGLGGENLALPPLSVKTQGVRWQSASRALRNESNDNSM